MVLLLALQFNYFIVALVSRRSFAELVLPIAKKTTPFNKFATLLPRENFGWGNARLEYSLARERACWFTA